MNKKNKPNNKPTNNLIRNVAVMPNGVATVDDNGEDYLAGYAQAMEAVVIGTFKHDKSPIRFVDDPPAYQYTFGVLRALFDAGMLVDEEYASKQNRGAQKQQ